MTRPSSWFVKKDTTDPIDASVLGKINVPGGAQAGSSTVVVDAATLAAVNVPYGAKEEAKPHLVNLKADDLLRVNVPTGEPLSRKSSRTASPAPASTTLEFKASDLANVNQTQS